MHMYMHAWLEVSSSAYQWNWTQADVHTRYRRRTEAVSKQTVTDTAYAYRDFVHSIPKVHVYSQIPLVVPMVPFLRV